MNNELAKDNPDYSKEEFFNPLLNRPFTKEEKEKIRKAPKMIPIHIAMDAMDLKKYLRKDHPQYEFV